jgi:uncharacterized protein (TIGR02145 family)
MKHSIIVISSFLFVCAAICSCSLNTIQRTHKLTENSQAADILITQHHFIDIRDHKEYKVVTIGTQIWLAENLAYKVSSGCWAYWHNDTSVYKYGFLYDWETAIKVCPIGWHLPADTEWTILTNYLGGEKIAGGKLKATAAWKYDANGKPNNSSGFDAFPTGRRNGIDGTFSYLGESTSFWSATPIDSMNAISRGLHYNSEDVHYGTNSRRNGFCVRCIKNMR